jgi:hypothetical protein
MVAITGEVSSMPAPEASWSSRRVHDTGTLSLSVPPGVEVTQAETRDAVSGAGLAGDRRHHLPANVA